MGVYVAWLESVVKKLQVPFSGSVLFAFVGSRVFLGHFGREARICAVVERLRVYKRRDGRCSGCDFIDIRFLRKRRKRVMELVIQALG